MQFSSCGSVSLDIPFSDAALAGDGPTRGIRTMGGVSGVCQEAVEGVSAIYR